MPISYFDLVLILIIAGFGLFGLWFGLVHTLGSLIGTVAGVYLASRYYEPVANWLVTTTGWGENFSKTLIFVIAFFIINRLVGVVFWILDKILGLITHLPFINSINRMLGLAFGLLEGSIVLGITFYFISKFPFGDHLVAWMADSKVVPPLINLASILWPLIPEAIKLIQTNLPEGIAKITNNIPTSITDKIPGLK
ncbi:MAG: hypothetical protein ACD_72C00200G0002 [uncultured bacterium]|nr:MAG: hypothetical protein ACD_72C00200G0002 [uncultured bacterium]